METAILVVERDQQIASMQIPINGGVGHKDNVQFAVVITVKQTHSSSHHLHQVALIRGKMRKGREPRLRSNVVKTNRNRVRSCRKAQEQNEGNDSDGTHSGQEISSDSGKSVRPSWIPIP